MNFFQFFILVTSFIFSLRQVSAQTDSLANNKTNSPKKQGYVKHEYNETLDSLSEVQKQLTKKEFPNTVKGYRVQIFSCSGLDCQEKAEAIYNQFIIAYPGISAYKLWDPPSLKVRTGDCRNRFEAEAIKEKIKEDFPFSFIVPDFIDSPYKVECEGQ